VARACECKPSGGYSRPTFTLVTYAHVLFGGHLSPLFSDKSYFASTEKVGQALVDEVIAKASAPPGKIVRDGNMDVYHAPMGRDIGMVSSDFASSVPFVSTQWVRMVVERSNCAGRWGGNEVVTIFPEDRPR
jgi:hypothetical protein